MFFLPMLILLLLSYQLSQAYLPLPSHKGYLPPRPCPAYPVPISEGYLPLLLCKLYPAVKPTTVPQQHAPSAAPTVPLQARSNRTPAPTAATFRPQTIAEAYTSYLQAKSQAEAQHLLWPCTGPTQTLL